MKKIKLLSMIVLSLGILQTGCKKDDEKDEVQPKKESPIVSLNENPGFIHEETMLFEGDIANIGIIAVQPDDGKLTKIELFRKKKMKLIFLN